MSSWKAENIANSEKSGIISIELHVNQFPNNEVIKAFFDKISNKHGYFDVAMYGTSKYIQFGNDMIRR